MARSGRKRSTYALQKHLLPVLVPCMPRALPTCQLRGLGQGRAIAEKTRRMRGRGLYGTVHLSVTWCQFGAINAFAHL
ncbi:hypothetical protein GQ53DRAFT_79931 [Thozetella sp. PMI_491]|nr:hypothetical protein GQ53DRAFT_79931 [Thozetella sp. PMI_491]